MVRTGLNSFNKYQGLKASGTGVADLRTMNKQTLLVTVYLHSLH